MTRTLCAMVLLAGCMEERAPRIADCLEGSATRVSVERWWALCAGDCPRSQTVVAADGAATFEAWNDGERRRRKNTGALADVAACTDLASLIDAVDVDLMEPVYGTPNATDCGFVEVQLQADAGSGTSLLDGCAGGPPELDALVDWVWGVQQAASDCASTEVFSPDLPCTAGT